MRDRYAGAEARGSPAGAASSTIPYREGEGGGRRGGSSLGLFLGAPKAAAICYLVPRSDRIQDAKRFQARSECLQTPQLLISVK